MGLLQLVPALKKSAVGGFWAVEDLQVGPAPVIEAHCSEPDPTGHLVETARHHGDLVPLVQAWEELAGHRLGHSGPKLRLLVVGQRVQELHLDGHLPRDRLHWR